MAGSDIIHVIDDDADVRQSLAFLLTTAGLSVRVHESADAFLKVLAEVQEGCIVTDVRMPGIDGIELQRQLSARGIRLPVIMMTGHGDVALAVEAMKAGAIDFIEKPYDNRMLLNALDNGFARIEDREKEASAIQSARDGIERLTPREKDVLLGLIDGKANKIIAFELDISPRTVEIYRANLMDKLGVRSVAEAVRIAFAAGLVPVFRS